MISKMFLNLALGFWVIGGLFIAIFITKAMQTLQLGPMNGNFYSCLVVAVWALPGVIIAWRNPRTHDQIIG